MIDLAVSAADPDQGMTLGELRACLDRILDSGAPEGSRVLVYASRAHFVRRVEVRFDDPEPITAQEREPEP